MGIHRHINLVHNPYNNVYFEVDTMTVEVDITTIKLHLLNYLPAYCKAWIFCVHVFFANFALFLQTRKIHDREIVNVDFLTAVGPFYVFWGVFWVFFWYLLSSVEFAKNPCREHLYSAKREQFMRTKNPCFTVYYRGYYHWLNRLYYPALLRERQRNITKQSFSRCFFPFPNKFSTLHKTSCLPVLEQTHLQSTSRHLHLQTHFDFW